MTPRTNAEWLHALKSSGREQTRAMEDLRAYLLRAAHYSLNRQRSELANLPPTEIEQLAEDCAQDALVAILKHLDEFRLESKFTTWAYKFAVNIALNAGRREIWKHVSLDQLLDQDIPALALQEDSASADPHLAALQGEVWDAVQEIIAHEITVRQRRVLTAVALDDVPLDEIARLFGSNRNAIYKSLHDARRQLKAKLEARGFAFGEIIETFSVKA
ncbi:MAG: RNA polymerase sigma factor [Chloroflexota bacterium]|nr:RNA polymerase sigma factor [Chloroflexota bacterium]